jgi:DNA gyrase subunit B/topoisomerase-4 subunit B
MAEVLAKTYTGKDIQVLEGLEPVRKRPGMYIGGTGKPGLHHLLWEIVDNAVDEATNGFATTIEVILHADGKSITVTDNGRGIPVDIHPKKKIPTLQVIMTTLHSGGKFDNTSYITSGGLHGVGSSVVNALSSELRATVKRDGKTYEQRYKRGKPTTKLKVVNGKSRGTGTSIFFRPDEQIFDAVEFDADLIREQLDVKTYLNSSLRIAFRDEKSKAKYEFHHEGGIAEYLTKVLADRGLRSSHAEPFLVKEERLENGARLELTLQWTEAPREVIVSFVNGIPTVDGGTHEQGLKDAVRSAVRSYMAVAGRRESATEPRTVSERSSLYRRGHCDACDSGSQGANGQSGGGARGAAQVQHQSPVESSGKAGRLLVNGSCRKRVVHR